MILGMISSSPWIIIVILLFLDFEQSEQRALRSLALWRHRYEPSWNMVPQEETFWLLWSLTHSWSYSASINSLLPFAWPPGVWNNDNTSVKLQNTSNVTWWVCVINKTIVILLIISVYRSNSIWHLVQV